MEISDQDFSKNSASEKSLAEIWSEQDAEEKRKRISTLTEEECEELFFLWDFWARPSQRLPSGTEWTYWLCRAGRGWGKTRVGAETVRAWVKDYPLVNLVGPTSSSVRDVMIEGPSGILAICPNSERPKYEPAKHKLTWPNGATSLLYSADEPARLRGPQHYKLWCDEIAAWRYVGAWEQAQLGLRLGKSPQAVITSTPKPIAIIRELSKDPGTILTTGTTYENRTNLAPKFFENVITKYEGTRLGRQELNAEVLEDNPNALFKRGDIDKGRVTPEEVPDLVRIVIPIDPAVTSNEDSCETGIVPVGMDRRNPPHFYVLEDVSGLFSPKDWAEEAITAYEKHDADRIIGEVNNGGDLVEANIRSVDKNASYEAVRASRGKTVRAEPIGSLYEQGRVHHVGSLAVLEDQMTNFNPNDPSEILIDRMEALVWGIAYLSRRKGRAPLAGFISTNTRPEQRMEKTFRKVG